MDGEQDMQYIPMLLALKPQLLIDIEDEWHVIPNAALLILQDVSVPQLPSPSVNPVHAPDDPFRSNTMGRDGVPSARI